MRRSALAITLLVCIAGAAHAGNIVISDPLSGIRAFGNVSVSAAPAVSTFSLTNLGSTTAVTGFSLGAGCAEFTASALVGGMPVSNSNPAILHDGEGLVVDVTYDPVDRAADACFAIVLDGDFDSDSVQLTGDGLAPQLMVTPGMLSFDDQEWNGGTPQVLDVTIGNDGEESITADDLTIVLTTGTHFQLGAVTPLPPIAPGGTTTLPVTFDPTSAGLKSDTVTVSLDNDAPGDPDPTVSLSGTGTGATATPTPTSTPTKTPTPTPTLTPTVTTTPGGITLDVDGIGGAQPLTDGLLLLRYLFGFRDAALVTNAVGGGCTRCTADEIEGYIASILGSLDVDGVGGPLPLSDGLLLLRYLFGFRDASLVTGAVGGGCTRCTAETIEPYIEGLL